MSATDVTQAGFEQLLSEWEAERASIETAGPRCAIQDYDAALAALRRAMRQAAEQDPAAPRQFEIAREYREGARQLVAAHAAAQGDLVGAMQKARQGLSIAPLTVMDLLEDTRRS